MRIDERIEDHVRAAFSAAIGKDGDGIFAALAGLREEDAREVLGLGLTVAEFILKDAFGDEPTPAELAAEAREMQEALPELLEFNDQDRIVTFLTAVAKGDTSLAGLPGEDVAWLTFVCGGYLLGTRRLHDQKWWEYLNEIWAIVDEPSGQ
jgi:hypothetical protein